MYQIHKINGTTVDMPKNYANLSIELNFDTDSQQRGLVLHVLNG